MGAVGHVQVTEFKSLKPFLAPRLKLSYCLPPVLLAAASKSSVRPRPMKTKAIARGGQGDQGNLHGELAEVSFAEGGLRRQVQHIVEGCRLTRLPACSFLQTKLCKFPQYLYQQPVSPPFEALRGIPKHVATDPATWQLLMQHNASVPTCRYI